MRNISTLCRERFNRGRSARPGRAAEFVYLNYTSSGMKPKLAARAAQLIYLNKTGYNGLYRVNSKGEFNVPFGRYVNPRIFDEEQIRRAAASLLRATTEVRDFETVSKRAGAGELVNFDPPYVSANEEREFHALCHGTFRPGAAGAASRSVPHS
jgi:DNA adenine methylase Dam